MQIQHQLLAFAIPIVLALPACTDTGRSKYVDNAVETQPRPGAAIGSNGATERPSPERKARGREEAEKSF
jgi:hypothetical protein